MASNSPELSMKQVSNSTENTWLRHTETQYALTLLVPSQVTLPNQIITFLCFIFLPSQVKNWLILLHNSFVKTTHLL